MLDRDGAEVSTKRDPLKTLFANIGDLLVVAAAELATDRIAMTEVVAMTRDGMPIVARLAGEMPSDRAVVIPGRKAKAK